MTARMDRSAASRFVRAGWLAGAVLVSAGLLSSGAAADDRHEGYYYPEPETSEVYEARIPTLPDSDRRRRIGFVTLLTNQMLDNPYPPPFAIFAKGTDAEKLIITSLYSGGYDTLYRARGLFAMLTAVSRATPFFQKLDDADRYTFFDLAWMLGFTQITWTDGDALAHRIELR